MTETPVLFITFARPDYARQTWDGIKAAKPKTLYFYSNKGRIEKEGEVARNEEIRSYIKEIDWDCNLHTWFRDECVNIYDSLRGAIDWLFDNEEQGIILEEDCVPTLAFFSYVDQLINKFRDDKRVWSISGDNFLRTNLSGYDYFFSHYHTMYGWASWRDRWNKINWETLHIEETIKDRIFYQLFKTKKQANAKEQFFVHNEEFLLRTKCWDYILGLTIDQNNGVNILPREHLVKNVGIIGTHSKKMNKFNVDVNPTNEQFIITNEPPFVFADVDYDYLMYKELLSGGSIIKRVINKIKAFFNK